MHDLVIRGGTVVDGTGVARRITDIAVDADPSPRSVPGSGVDAAKSTPAACS